MGIELADFSQFELNTVIFHSVYIIETYFLCPSFVQIFPSVNKAAAYAQDSLPLFIRIWVPVLHFFANVAITLTYIKDHLI
jgi:hypothetical protein